MMFNMATKIVINTTFYTGLNTFMNEDFSFLW